MVIFATLIFVIVFILSKFIKQLQSRHPSIDEITLQIEKKEETYVD